MFGERLFSMLDELEQLQRTHFQKIPMERSEEKKILSSRIGREGAFDMNFFNSALSCCGGLGSAS